MKILTTIVIVALSISGLADELPQATQTIDYSDLGLILEIPDTWESNVLIKTTKQDHYAAQGRMYNEADWDEIVHGFFQFLEIEVDSSFLPAPEAYESHSLVVQMHGYYGWYQRWLWSQGKKSLWEHFPTFTGTHWKDYLWTEEEELSDQDERKIIKDAYAVEYEWVKDSTHAGSKGQIYWLVRNDRCYKIVIDGSRSHYEENRPIYEAVLDDISFTN